MTGPTTTFTDPETFLARLAPLREATFSGTDLHHDAARGTMSLRLRRPAGRRAEHVVVTVRGVDNYRQSLTHGPGGVYILDRVEVGRGGREIAFYFRPGDRAVMDVDRIDGTLEGSGDAVSPHDRPVVLNPLTETSPRARGFLARLLGR